MKDINYFRQILSEENQKQEKLVDKWLDDVGIPQFKGNGTVYEIPDNIPNFVDKLRKRGFDVNICNGYQSSFIYLSLP